MLTRVLQVVALLFSISVVVAGVFAYRYSAHNLHIGYPVVWLEDPGSPGVRVLLYRNKTLAVVNISVSEPLLERAYRSAIYFDTFDDNPFTAGRMTSFTCA